MKVVRRLGVEPEFVASLGKARKFARGPKPGKALREIALEPQMTTERAFTDALNRADHVRIEHNELVLSGSGSDLLRFRRTN